MRAEQGCVKSFENTLHFSRQEYEQRQRERGAEEAAAAAAAAAAAEKANARKKAQDLQVCQIKTSRLSATHLPPSRGSAPLALHWWACRKNPSWQGTGRRRRGMK